MMNKIITAKVPDPDLATDIDKVAAQYPAKLQASVTDAFLAADKQDFERAIELCLKLLDYGAVPEIRALLGICYFMKGKVQKAETIFSDLVRDFPEIDDYHMYHGTINHALGRFEEVVQELGKLYPLSIYRPFYYTCYGDSLLALGRLKQSRDAFHEEVAYFEKTGEIVSEQILDGAFENLLYLDITLGNGKYPEDIKLYYDFLDQTEMTQEMQENLAGNIVYFCSLMSNKWYRPMFLEFITHIREKGFLTDKAPLETLESAFASWESFAYHEDRLVSALMESYLAAINEKKYTLGNIPVETEILAVTYEWYMCQYTQDHPEEIEYIKEKYPYTYANIREFVEKMEADREKMSKKLMDELYKYTNNVSRQKFEESMRDAYQKACKDKKEPAYIYDGMETYRRIQPKVGRNDPCPCGSGKKYKKCCGR